MNATKIDIEIKEREELDDIDHVDYIMYSANIYDSETGELLHHLKEHPLLEELFIDILSCYNIYVNDLKWKYE